MTTAAGQATTRAVQPTTRRRRRHGTLSHPSRTGFLLVLPAVLFVVVFVVVPLLIAIGIAFTNFPLIGDARFVGLANFATALVDPTLWSGVLYTVVYTAIVTLPILLTGYVLALVVRANRWGSTLLRTVFFLPYVLGLSTLSFMVLLEAQPNSGALDIVLKALGITDGSTAWLVNGPLATGLICGLIIWGVSGLTMVLLMSGMQGIPRELYESAELDGASWWQMERRVTIPLLRRTIAMSVIISVIGSFLGFTQFYILTQGGPGSATTPVVLAIYRRAFVDLQLGNASAMSLILVVLVGIITVVQFVVLRNREDS